MSENINRNNVPIPAPHVENKTRAEQDERWKKVVGVARVKIATDAIDKQVADQFETADPWE